jgi:hypothetical protein
VGKIFTIENIINYVRKNSDCELLSTTYIDEDSPLLFKCSCKEIFEMSYRNFKRNKYKSCKMCLGKRISCRRKLSYEKIKYYIEVESRSGCKLLSETYDGARQKLKLQCKCGNIFYITYNGFASKTKQKQQCNSCSNITNWNTFLINNYIESTSNVQLLNINEDLHYDSILRLKCMCGKEYNQKFNKFYMSKFKCCNECMIRERGLNIRNSYEEVKQNVESVSGYKLISKKYNGYRDKLKILCPEGHTFMMSYKNFYYEHCRCLSCSESKPVQRIKKYLQDNFYIFEQEYKFEDLLGIGNNLLRFDFAIFEDIKKTKLKCLIEYDGQFHFKKFYDGDGYETTVIHDKLKDKYCINNNIRLIRIPYWKQDNVENILMEVIDGRL